jgi:hypothetical protein
MPDGGVDQVHTGVTGERRATGGAGAGRGIQRALVFDVARESRGQRTDRQIVRFGLAAPAAGVARRLATEPRDLAVHAHGIDPEGIGAHHEIER